MNLIHTILASLLPIFFVTGLGWCSGRRGWLKDDATETLAPFVIKFALPLALFLAAAKADRSQILNAPFVGTLFVGIIGTLVLGYLVGRFVWKKKLGDAAVEGVSTSFANMAYCGPPVMTAVVGAGGMLSIVIGNLILSMFLLPSALLALSHEASGGKASLSKTLRGAILQPLVLLPLAGLIIALGGIKLPDLVNASVDQIGKASGGVALFTLGLILGKIKPEFNREILGNVVIKNLVQPALLLGVGLLVGLQEDMLKQAFLLGVLPTATAVPTFALAQKAYAHNAAETVLVSTLTSILTISVGIAIATHL